MAHTYVKITGKDQKDFKGESSRKGRTDWLEASVQFKSEFLVDPNTGKPKGAIERGPVLFTKEEGAATTNILQALHRQESIDKIVIEKVARGEDGKSEVVVSRITLEGGYIASYNAYPSNTDTDRRADPRHMEEFAISSRKFTFEHVLAKNATSVDWNEPNA